MGYTRADFPKTRRLRKTRLTPRNKALMDWFATSLEYGGRIKHTIIRVSPKARDAVSPLNFRLKRGTRRYFQLELTGDWQHDITGVIVPNLTGYSEAVKKENFDYQRMINEVDGYVKYHFLQGSSWTLFRVRSIKVREFARVFK